MCAAQKIKATTKVKMGKMAEQVFHKRCLKANS